MHAGAAWRRARRLPRPARRRWRRRSRWPPPRTSSAFARRGTLTPGAAPRVKARLQRDVAVLALGPGLALGEQRLERGDELRPRLVGNDHVVDVPALGRGVGVREAGLVVGDELLAPGVRRRRVLEVA